MFNEEEFNRVYQARAIILRALSAINVGWEDAALFWSGNPEIHPNAQTTFMHGGREYVATIEEQDDADPMFADSSDCDLRCLIRDASAELTRRNGGAA